MLFYLAPNYILNYTEPYNLSMYPKIQCEKSKHSSKKEKVGRKEI